MKNLTNISTTNEEWKTVTGFPNYQVSDLGRVRTFIEGSEFVLNQSNGKYKHVRLKNSGKSTRFKLHVLVAMEFLDHVPNGMNIVVDHISNDSSDNRLSNLQLISQRLNSSKDRLGGSIYTGVCKSGNLFLSQISIHGTKVNLGTYKYEEDAAEMYNKSLLNLDLFFGCPKSFRLMLGYNNKTHELSSFKMEEYIALNPTQSFNVLDNIHCLAK